MPPEVFQQFTIALERSETIAIAAIVGGFTLGVGLYGLVLYLTFGKVLIPLTNSLCNYLNAKAWAVDHQYKARLETGGTGDARYKPKL